MIRPSLHLNHGCRSVRAAHDSAKRPTANGPRNRRPCVNGSGLTCIQNLDDSRGLLNVKGDTVKPTVLHQEHVDVEAVTQGPLGLGLESAGLVRVIFGPEPVSKVVIPKKNSGEGVAGGWDEWEAVVRIQI